MTYSLVAFDRETGALGSAVASRSVAVGGSVAYSRLGVGLVNTQHRAHLVLGESVLDRMTEGMPPEQALNGVLHEDRSPDTRQFLAIDVRQRLAVWTGPHCEEVKAQVFRPECAAAGNLLASEAVVERMVEAFEGARGTEFGLRLLLGLEAGEESGGDRRGTRSAAVLILPPQDARVEVNLDLRVDDHDEPLTELRRVYDAFVREFPR